MQSKIVVYVVILVVGLAIVGGVYWWQSHPTEPPVPVMKHTTAPAAHTSAPTTAPTAHP